MPIWLIALIAAVVVVAAAAVLRRRPAAPKVEAERRLDTVVAWPPSATRILSSAERQAYATLGRALPGYMVLAQVPLARFLKVPTRHSYSEWLRRLGTLCADLVVCDMASEVLAVIEIQPPAGAESERARKRLNRMARVLKAAGIPMHVWTDVALPSVEAAREMIMPSAAGAPAPAKPTSEPATSQAAVLEALDREAPLDDGPEQREPPPSTWFDEFNSGPAPLGQRSGAEPDKPER